MSIHLVDPVHDARWAELLLTHPHASVFHTPGWLEALRQTYGYEPVVLTTSPPGAKLTTGLPVCHVKTWFAGRLVSLPFSDHCQPLVGQSQDLPEILSYLNDGVEARTWKRVELRPLGLAEKGLGDFRVAQNYCFHRLDLSPTLDELFARFHPSCMQRSIRRAEREKLDYEAGSSESLLTSFYGLLRMTRRRQGLPPQPLSWFRNLMSCLGDGLTIRLASKDGRPIACLLTLSFRETIVYKYGCSDANFHKLGGMPFLFWKLLQEAKAQGFEALDLGRSDLNQPGLITFKDRLGARRSTLTYYGHPTTTLRPALRDGWTRRMTKRVFERLPDPALTVAGRLLYKHFG